MLNVNGKRRLLFMVLACCAVIGSYPVHGAEYLFKPDTGLEGNWNNSDNWSEGVEGQVPGPGDIADVLNNHGPAAGTATVNVTDDRTVHQIWLGAKPWTADAGRIDVETGGHLTTNNGFYVGKANSGYVRQYAGSTVTVNHRLYLGYEYNASHTPDAEVIYDIHPGATLEVVADGRLRVGYDYETKAQLNLGSAGDPAAGAPLITEFGGTGGNMMIYHQGAHVKGWGEIRRTGSFKNSGKIIASGYGDERTLDLSSFTGYDWFNNNGTDKGSYAENKGKLLMPAFSPDGGSSYNWGEWINDAEDTLDMINGVNITGTSLSGDLLGALLASDRSELTDLSGTAIGAWEFDTAGFSHSGNLDLEIRYDEALASGLGFAEGDLRLYQKTNGTWNDITSSIDTTNHIISADGVGSLSTFAVVPEPLTIILIGLGTLGLIKRRK